MALKRRSRRTKARYYSGGLVILFLLVVILVGLLFFVSPDRKAERFLGRAESLPEDDRRRESYLENAASIYETKLARNPRHVEGLLGLANVYLTLGRYDEAIANYQEATAYDDKGIVGARDYYQLGVAYLRRGRGGDSDKASKFLQRASEGGHQGNDPEVAFTLGEIYKESRRYREAISHYEKGMELGPAPAEAHYVLGWLYYNEGFFTQSAGQYKKAADLNPGFAEAHYWLGKVYDKLNQRSEALSEWRESIKINPSHQYAKYVKEKLEAR